MNTKTTLLALCAVGVTTAASAGQTISINVTPSLAPNFFGSGSWGTYLGNAMTALENNQNAFGTAGTPGYYEAYGNDLTAAANVVTNFNSWRGVADPAAPYSSELGNRVHFGLHAVSETQLFSLSQLSFDMNSTDPGNIFDYDGSFSAADTYSATRIGINYGVDGLKGTGDDIIYSGGESAINLVNELMYVGIGNAVEALTTDPGATNQDKIDGVLASSGLGAGYSIMTTYTIDGFSGNATAVFQPVPEPATIAALGAGVLVLLRRRRKA